MASCNEKETVGKEQEETGPSQSNKPREDSNANTTEPKIHSETTMPTKTELKEFAQKSSKEISNEEKTTSEAKELREKLKTKTTQTQNSLPKHFAEAPEKLTKETTKTQDMPGKKMADTKEKTATKPAVAPEQSSEIYEVQESLVKEILEKSLKKISDSQPTPTQKIEKESAAVITKELPAEDTQERSTKLITEPTHMHSEKQEKIEKEITEPTDMPAKEIQEKSAKDIAVAEEKCVSKAQEAKKIADPQKTLVKDEEELAKEAAKLKETSKETLEKSAKDITEVQTTPVKETKEELAEEAAKLQETSKETLEKSAKGITEAQTTPVKETKEELAEEAAKLQETSQETLEKSAKETTKAQKIPKETQEKSSKEIKSAVEVALPQEKSAREQKSVNQSDGPKANGKPEDVTGKPSGNTGIQITKPPLMRTPLTKTDHPKGKSTKADPLQPKLQFMDSEDEPLGSEFEDMNTYADYFDIMIIGKTGVGKTTTTDKLLLANPTGKIYRPTKKDDKKKMGASNGQGPAKGGSSQRRRSSQANSHIAQVEDLSMWHISDEVGDIDMVEQRLKNLLYCRLSDKPHEEVNKLREESEVTKCCELLSNDTSKIRILDVPGFFSSKKIEPKTSKDMLEGAQSTISNNLLTMRKILHIKTAYQFKFNRIVYFLPERGVLNTNSQVLQMELQMMETYFGRTIFECMLVVATHDRSAYKSFKGSEKQLYSAKDFEKTKSYLLQGIRAVFPDLTLIPRPPLEFISYHSTCEELLNLIKGSNVVREGVKLTFNASTCARCHTVLKRVKPKIFQEEGKPGDHPDVITCRHLDINEDIPYDDSSCHPMIIPKYSLLQRVFGGIVHVLMPIKYVKRNYPSFKNFEEVCMACGKTPGTIGCKQVKRLYRRKCRSCRSCRHCEYCGEECRKTLEWIECGKCRVCKKCQKCSACKEGILVDHTDRVREKYKIKKDHID